MNFIFLLTLFLCCLVLSISYAVNTALTNDLQHLTRTNYLHILSIFSNIGLALIFYNRLKNKMLSILGGSKRVLGFVYLPIVAYMVFCVTMYICLLFRLASPVSYLDIFLLLTVFILIFFIVMFSVKSFKFDYK